MDEKILKRDVRDVWAELRRLRRARAKLTSADELAESASLVTEFSAQLTTLSARARTLEGAVSPESAGEGATAAKPKKKQSPNAGKSRAAPKKKKAKKKA